ncbi:competence damage-inducible protein A [Spirochaetia bacterium]|nr:competence damage-inducible protein A [Spirochaetia bacterium]
MPNSGDATAAELLVKKLTARSKTLALAESCTAGLAADLIARLPGASNVLWGSFVSYTVDAKVKMLGLDRAAIEKYGPVSRETACAMAEGALEKSGADFAAAVTGLAGPGGDGTAVPVGTVWIALAVRGGETGAQVFHYKDSRNGVRNSAAEQAVKALLTMI